MRRKFEMNIAEACNVVAEIARNENTQVLELLVEYRNDCDEYGVNDYYNQEQNRAFRLFINQAQNFFAPAEV
jgi:hypothetical protein